MPTMNLAVHTLLPVLEATKHARYSEKDRHALQFLCITALEGNAGLKFCTTSGHVLVELTLGKPSGGDGEWTGGLKPGRYLASPETVDRAIALCKLEVKAKRTGEVVPMEVEEDNGKNPSNVTFPDYAKGIGAVGEASTECAWFNPALVDLLTAAAQRLKLDCLRFQPGDDRSPMRLDGAHEQWVQPLRFVGVVMPMWPGKYAEKTVTGKAGGK